ncbi:AAEL009271-PA, partial [Aedes aegypti]
TKCPGLDLHFWRKVCRNCKCRKEQHDCKDDVISGWAQFEILGAIRSQSAYIKISELTDKLVQLDWIPPNVTADLASDYMSKIGAANIPIAGSDAAKKRKQQLEYQIPPHDLDATLCHNLSENEATQLVQYVEKIRKSCVGQGNVVRIGDLQKHSLAVGNQQFSTADPTVTGSLTNKLLNHILCSDPIKNAFLGDPKNAGKKICIQSDPMEPDFNASPYLSDKMKYKLKLMKVNSEIIRIAVEKASEIDNVIEVLNSQKMSFKDSCNLMGPLYQFRQEYKSNPKFQAEINKYLFSTAKPESICAMQPMQRENLKAYNIYSITNFVKNSNLTPFGITVDQVPDIAQEIKAAQDKNTTLTSLLKNPSLQEALKYGKQLSIPLHLSSNIPMNDKLACSSKISGPTYDKIANMKIDHTVLESVVLYGPMYDQLIQQLNRNGVDISNDSLLDSIKTLRNEYNNDEHFRRDLERYIVHPEPNLFEPPSIEKNTKDEQPLATNLDDSGFESVPPTPNYSTYPGFAKQTENYTSPGTFDELPSNGAIPKNVHVSEPSAKECNLPGHDISKLMPISQSPNYTVCNGCSTSITFGEVVVTAERVGSNAAWHPQCFKCHKCSELLADLVYFYHGGQVYCGRDLANILKIPRCAACDELIFTKEYTAAEGATFHIKHFCCYHCDAPLAGQQYVPDENSSMPVCLNCYDTYFAKTCHYCHATIGPTEQGVAWNNIHWHGVCFVCNGKECGRSLIGGRFCIKSDMPFCSPQCVKSIQF